MSCVALLSLCCRSNQSIATVTISARHCHVSTPLSALRSGMSHCIR